MPKHSSRIQMLSLAFLLSFMALTPPERSWGGGLMLYEIGTSDTGYASAGYAARANDAGTVLTNPAGMTRLQGSQLVVGGHLLYGHAEFSPDSTTSPELGNDNGSNAMGLLPGLSIFATTPLNDDFTVGFGMFSNFGLGLWYDSNWVGRYYAKEAVLMGLSFMPAAAYRISEQVSVGVGLNIMVGYLKDTVAINTLGSSDGELAVKDTTVGVGGNVGILYEPSKSTRFGVTYSSPVKLNFSDTPQFSNVGPLLGDLQSKGLLNSSLDLGVTVPQSVMVSFYHDINDRWALLGNFGWQNWSSFGKVDVSYNTTSLTTGLKYNDTWHGALGAQYRISEPWLVTGGVAYDSSMVDDANRSPALPLAWSWRFALGGEYAISKTAQLGFAYEYLYCGDPSIYKSGDLDVPVGGRGTLSGSYPNLSLQFFSANMSWKF